MENVVGKLLPGVAAKPAILRQRFDAGGMCPRFTLCMGTVKCKIGKARAFSGRLFNKLHLLTRRHGQMHNPVGIGACHGARRQAACETRKCCMGGAVENVL